METENKSDWCNEGRTVEEHFVHLYGDLLRVAINPGKDESVYVPDLIWHGKRDRIAELKSRQTPFFVSQILYGIPSQQAVTINQNDIESYRNNYPRLPIYFWVDWTTLDWKDVTGVVSPMTGVWGINLTDLLPLCTPQRLHSYKRRVNDTNGNAKTSYVVDLADMKLLVDVQNCACIMRVRSGTA